LGSIKLKRGLRSEPYDGKKTPKKKKERYETALEVNREASNRGRNHSEKSRTI
jgi:hypothetical protein